MACSSSRTSPLPKTWFASDASAFRSLPLIPSLWSSNPSTATDLAGLALLTRRDVGLLPALEGKQSVYLAQELLQTDGWDLKLYGIRQPRLGGTQTSPVSFPEPGAADVVIGSKRDAELVKIDARLRDIALTCGRACGLELWGVDVAMTPRGPFVIEVNDFPTYSAVPDAGEAIAHTC